MYMIKLRELQDETAGFQCFVPYPFLHHDSRLPEAQLATGTEVLRVIVNSRLMLNNIPHIKVYRMNLKDEISELALQFGADDIDGTHRRNQLCILQVQLHHWTMTRLNWRRLSQTQARFQSKETQLTLSGDPFT